MFKASNYSEKHSGINSNSSNHLVARSARLTAHSAMFLAQELNHEAIVIHTHIPRPSIIGVPKQEEAESRRELELPTMDYETLSDLARTTGKGKIIFMT
ncbi:hypothetical protein Y1Q_0023427 [Alligator mississippiensis]|uniref:Uncharacterized protein n=1 Tax=Alligator mississippiensis TaxID=8496 RepID=A0A151NPL9_ALLMI|nr:hypothetical protein Y1Q_0023427 [Alligator mississippiensis]